MLSKLIRCYLEYLSRTFFFTRHTWLDGHSFLFLNIAILLESSVQTVDLMKNKVYLMNKQISFDEETKFIT